MIRLIVFDMDGLLVDTERQMYVKTGLEVSQEIGHPVTQEFLCSLMGGSWDTYLSHFTEEYGDDFPVDEYWEKYEERVHYIVENEALPLQAGRRRDHGLLHRKRYPYGDRNNDPPGDDRQGAGQYWHP